MDRTALEEILATVATRPPRSRLEPYRELIEALRRRGISFREIAEILASRCNVRVTRAAIHDFLKVRTCPRKAGIVKQQTATVAAQSVAAVEEISDSISFEYDSSLPLILPYSKKPHA